MLMERKIRRERMKGEKGGRVKGGKTVFFFLLEKNVLIVNFMSTWLGLATQIFD